MRVEIHVEDVGSKDGRRVLTVDGRLENGSGRAPRLAIRADVRPSLERARRVAGDDVMHGAPP
ncbi:hypothetical protein BGLA2_190035 [Burkholderia gladioli]|nr:hypothetical protein BGLA2_190035 [Burkholderia gladioli]